MGPGLTLKVGGGRFVLEGGTASSYTRDICITIYELYFSEFTNNRK